MVPLTKQGAATVANNISININSSIIDRILTAPVKLTQVPDRR